VLENKVLRRIFVPKKDVIGGGGNGEKRNVYSLLVGKPEGRIPLGRYKWSGVDWIGLA
jgi:hypothetical protein